MGIHDNATRYRDVPEEADSVSMHTTRSDHEYNDEPELPSYSESEAAASASRDVINSANSTNIQMLTYDPYPRVQPYTNWQNISKGKVKNANETTIRMGMSIKYNLSLRLLRYGMMSVLDKYSIYSNL